MSPEAPIAEAPHIDHRDYRDNLSDFRKSDRVARGDFAEQLTKVLASGAVDSVHLRTSTGQPAVMPGDICIPGDSFPFMAREVFRVMEETNSPIVSVGDVVEADNKGSEARAEEIAKALLPHLTRKMDAAFLTCDDKTALDNVNRLVVGKGVNLPLKGHGINNLALDHSDPTVEALEHEAGEYNPHREARRQWFLSAVAPKLSPVLRQHFIDKILPTLAGKVYIHYQGGTEQEGDVRVLKSPSSATGYVPWTKEKSDELYCIATGYPKQYFERDFATWCSGIPDGDRLDVFYNLDRRFSKGGWTDGHFDQVDGGYAFVVGFADNNGSRRANMNIEAEQIKVERLKPKPSAETAAGN